MVLDDFYRPAQVAAMLHCSEWWIKEQARRRRIPYAWIGGSYLFTAKHIEEIIRRFEVQPLDVPDAVYEPVPRQPVEPEDVTVVQLSARPPRRARAAGRPDTSAA